jgi:hypothetical protein
MKQYTLDTLYAVKLKNKIHHQTLESQKLHDLNKQIITGFDKVITDGKREA